MKPLSQKQIKRLTAVHGWSGTILGLLLYAVVLTGTAAVFGHEIAEWSVGGAHNPAPLSKDIDDKVRPALDKVTKGYLGEISIWNDARGDLIVFAHAHAKNPDTGRMDEYGPMFRISSHSGEILSRNDGFAFDRPEWYSASALEEFLVDLHVQLYMPKPWGLIVTGILGLSMMVAAVTGFLMHRHLIRDLFVAARPGERLVSARDRHILAASWSLLFAFLLGFTGSFYSFAGTVTFPMLAEVAFGGDREAMVETLFEPPVAADATPSQFTDLDSILEQAQSHTAAPVVLLSIARYGRADARVSVWQLPPEKQLGYIHNVFDGASGKFLGTRPIVGNSPSVGSTLYGLMAPLHFGHFAGLLSKSVWVGLGTAMCFVILSGLRLWVRRREEDHMWRGFGRAVTITAYGLPGAMVFSCYGFFLAASLADPFLWTPRGFLIGAVIYIVLGLANRDEKSQARIYRILLGTSCFLLPFLRMATGGLDWFGALAQTQYVVLSFDLAMLIVGVSVVFWARFARSATSHSPRAMEPAE